MLDEPIHYKEIRNNKAEDITTFKQLSRLFNEGKIILRGEKQNANTSVDTTRSKNGEYEKGIQGMAIESTERKV